MNNYSINKLSLNSLIENKIVEYRFPKCLLIPFINVTFNENNLFIKTKCINNHNYSNSFDEMKKLLTQNPIKNNICESVKLKIKIKKLMIFFIIIQYVSNLFVLNMKKIMNIKIKLFL